MRKRTAGWFGGAPRAGKEIDTRRAAERLAAFLDRVTPTKSQNNHIDLANLSHGIGPAWTQKRGHIILIPRLGGAVTAERELVAFADALVVVGDPAPWARLVRFANEAGKPVRFFAG